MNAFNDNDAPQQDARNWSSRLGTLAAEQPAIRPQGGLPAARSHPSCSHPDAIGRYPSPLPATTPKTGGRREQAAAWGVHPGKIVSHKQVRNSFAGMKPTWIATRRKPSSLTSTSPRVQNVSFHPFTRLAWVLCAFHHLPLVPCRRRKQRQPFIDGRNTRLLVRI